LHNPRGLKAMQKSHCCLAERDIVLQCSVAYLYTNNADKVFTSFLGFSPPP